MEKIRLSKAAVLTSPNPVTIVCTLKEDGTTNAATVSWWTYLSFNPEMIAYAMSKKSFSGECVRANKKVILTVPGTEIADAVMTCGTASGRDTDKISKAGMEMISLPETDIKVPLHSRVAIECTMKEFVEVGDHYLYICEVENVYGNDEEEPLYAWNGYSEIRPAH